MSLSRTRARDDNNISSKSQMCCWHKYTAASDVIIKLLKGSVKEPNKFHSSETEKVTYKASDAAEYIKLFGSSTRDRHARRI